MLKLNAHLRIHGRLVSTEIQCMVLGAHLQKIDRGEIICWVHDWLNCSIKEATKIVDSTLISCIKEKVKL